MTQKQRDKPLLRLTLPAAALQRLRRAAFIVARASQSNSSMRPNVTSCAAVNLGERPRNSATT